MIRYEFIDEEFSNANFHPGAVFEQERELARNYVSENITPNKNYNYFFKRYDVPYFFDTDKNLRADVKLTDSQFQEYFYTSDLSKLRASQAYQEQIKENRSKIWESYVEWIEGRCFRYFDKVEDLQVLDVGSRAVGWIEELKRSKHFQNLYVHNSLPPVKSEMSAPEDNDLAIAFNVIQREQNPKKFITDLGSKLRSGGIAVLAFRSGVGFDILALKENNKSIFPLDHLFLPSPQGIRHLFEANGFEVLEITTPGQLDAEIVKKTLEESDYSDPLLNHIFEQTPTDEVQSFIQKNNLSSHVRLVARKK